MRRLLALLLAAAAAADPPPLLGSADGVTWLVQLSDLHLSLHVPSRCAPVLPASRHVVDARTHWRPLEPLTWLSSPLECCGGSGRPRWWCPGT